MGKKSLIWQYDKNTGKISKSPVSVRNICCRDYYYYQRDEKGEVDHISIEDSFSDVERLGLKIINDLKVENFPSKIVIGEEDQSQLAFFSCLNFNQKSRI